MYTGALSEPPMEGAIFGPLLSCMVSDQFLRIKLGDSHWYERKVGPQRFTKGLCPRNTLSPNDYINHFLFGSAIGGNL